MNELMNNQLVLTLGNKLGLLTDRSEIEIWTQLLTHVFEECSIRNLPYPPSTDPRQFAASHPIPLPDGPIAKAAVRECKRFAQRIQSPILVKYGKREFLEPMLSSGQIRIAPASFYNDPSLNPATKDDELTLWFDHDHSTTQIKVLDSNTGKTKLTFSREDVLGLQLGTRSTTNYYVFCVAYSLSPRLFLDFSSDACLIIRKPGEFCEKLRRAVAESIPDFECIAGTVDYHDPVLRSPDKVHVFFAKHMRYAYQKEMRMVWVPPNNRKELEPLSFEIGGLNDFCELIELDD